MEPETHNRTAALLTAMREYTDWLVADPSPAAGAAYRIVSDAYEVLHEIAYPSDAE